MILGTPTLPPAPKGARGPGLFIDRFDRGTPDVVTAVGNGWSDLADLYPAEYDRIGILNGGTVCRTLSRPHHNPLPWTSNPDDVGGADDFLNQPGTIIPGICGIYRDTGTVSARVSVLWSGNWGPAAGLHTECTPALHVTPGTTELGIGMWPGYFGTTPVLGVGYVGNPPELFFVDAGASFTHTHGTPRWVTLDSDGTEFTVWLSAGTDLGASTQVSVSTYGLDPIPVPASLQRSTRHGLFVDQHMVDYVGGAPSLSRMQSAAGITEIRMALR